MAHLGEEREERERERDRERLGLVVENVITGEKEIDMRVLREKETLSVSPSLPLSLCWTVVIVEKRTGKIEEILSLSLSILKKISQERESEKFEQKKESGEDASEREEDQETEEIKEKLKGIDLLFFPPGATLLPGFIDCHVHLSISTDDYQLDHLKKSSAEKALRCLKAAQGLLHAGFTTIRSAGDADTYYPSFAVAKSIENGEFDGPLIVGAGHYISVTGGGGDINFLAPDSCPCCLTDGIIADGHDEMVKAVRKEIKYGSDWIKVLATGAFMSASTGPKDSPENTHFSIDELVTCVHEAKRRQVPVMAHAHGAEGIAQAARAGTSYPKCSDFVQAAALLSMPLSSMMMGSKLVWKMELG
jgi:hypothetical protein